MCTRTCPNLQAVKLSSVTRGGVRNEGRTDIDQIGSVEGRSMPEMLRTAWKQCDCGLIAQLRSCQYCLECDEVLGKVTEQQTHERLREDCQEQ